MSHSRETVRSKFAADGHRVKAERDKGPLDLLRYHRTRHMAIMWTPTVLCLIAAGLVLTRAWWEIPLGIAGGLLVYSLIEYVVHRFVMHDEEAPQAMRTITSDQAGEHAKHHERPSNMNSAINGRQNPILALAMILTVVGVVAPGPTGAYLIGVAVGAASYVGQEFMHYACHQFPMRGPILSAYKRNHMLHHYQDESCNFGILFWWWDIVFGTTFQRKARRLRRARGGMASAASPGVAGEN